MYVAFKDLAQFEQFFKSHYRALNAYAMSLTKDPIHAEDIVQSVFLKVWEKRDNIQIVSDSFFYLKKSVKNEYLNHIEHIRVRKTYTAHVLFHADQCTEDVDSIESMQYSELETALENAIEALPNECKKVFKLSRFEELKYREIADRLGISIKTVENQMGKALKNLRLQLIEFLPIFLILFFQFQ